jgi:predicted nucleotidyltransferase
MQNKTDILKELKNSLRNRFGNDVKDVILFGSRAAGTANDDSDYDILIVFSREYDDRQFRERLTDILYNTELRHDILIDAHLISVGELETSLRGAQPVFANAVKYGVYA